MAARQLPHHLGRRARHPARSARRRSSAACRASPPTSSPGCPRIYALALELIRPSAGRLDAQRLQRFITRVPVGHAADDGRAVGVAERAEAGAASSTCARAADVLADEPRAPARRRSPGRRARERRRDGQPTGRPTCIRRSSRACCSARASSAPPAARAAARARRGAGGARRDDRGRDPRRRAAPGGRAGVDGQPDRQPAARSRPSTGASSSRASASSSRCCSAIRPASTAGWTSAAATAIATRSRSWRSRPARRSCCVALKSVERARQVARADARRARRRTSATT